MISYIFCYGHSRVLLSILHVFYAACVFYGTAFMYNHDILCIFSPILEVEINIIIIPMHIKHATSVNVFKQMLKKHLINTNLQGIVTQF